MKILLIQLKRIGDTVLMAPIIDAIKNKYSESRITMVVKSESSGVASMITGLDSVLAYRRRSFDFIFWQSVMGTRFDYCFDFTSNERSTLVSALSCARYRVCYAKHKNFFSTFIYNYRENVSVRELHTIDFYFGLLGLLNLKKIKRSKLHIGVGDINFFRKKLSDLGIDNEYVVVHPGAAVREKFWLDKNWSDFINYVSKTTDVVISGGVSTEEQLHIKEIMSRLKNTTKKVVSVAGTFSLEQTSALIANSRVLVSVDTVVVHIGGMLGVPQIALFGKTNPFHWRPLHEKSCVVLASADSQVNNFSPYHNKVEMNKIGVSTIIQVYDRLRNKIIDMN